MTYRYSYALSLLLSACCSLLHAAGPTYNITPTELRVTPDVRAIAVGNSLSLTLLGGKTPVCNYQYLLGSCGFGEYPPPEFFRESRRDLPDKYRYCRIRLNNGPWQYQPTPFFQIRTSDSSASSDGLLLPAGEYTAEVEAHQAWCIHDLTVQGGKNCSGCQTYTYGDSASFRVVRIQAVNGPEGFSTSCRSYPADYLSLPVGRQDSEAAFTAIPWPSGDWPANTPTWSAISSLLGNSRFFRISDDRPGKVTIDTASPDQLLCQAKCGSSAILFQLNIVGVKKITPSAINFGDYSFNLFNLHPLEDQNDNRNGVRYVLPAVSGATLTVQAFPTPDLPEERLPRPWQFTGGATGDADSRIYRLADIENPGILKFKASCGESSQDATIILSRLDLDIGPTDNSDSTTQNSLFKQFLPTDNRNQDTVRNNQLLLLANDGDQDEDGIPDNQDCCIDASPSPFTPVTLKIENLPNPEQYRFRLEYQNAGIISSDLSPTAPFYASGLRIWRKPSSEQRDPRPVRQGGDYLLPDSNGYSPAELGMTLSTDQESGLGNGEVTFYLEGCGQFNRLRLRVSAISPTAYPATAQLSLEDSAEINCLSLAATVREAPYTGGLPVPDRQLMTFGLPLVINDNYDEYLYLPESRPFQPDCQNNSIDSREDLNDLARLSLRISQTAPQDKAFADLSIEGPLRVYLDEPPYRLAYDNVQLINSGELYKHLAQGRGFLLEGYGEGIAKIAIKVNDFPFRTIGKVRLIRASRHLVTPDPEFEITAALSGDDNFRQGELMADNAAVFSLQSLPDGQKLTGHFQAGPAVASLPGLPDSSLDFPITDPHIVLRLSPAKSTSPSTIMLSLPNGKTIPLAATGPGTLLITSEDGNRLAALPLKIGPLFKINPVFSRSSDNRPQGLAFNPCNSPVYCQSPFPNAGDSLPQQAGFGLGLSCVFQNCPDIPANFMEVRPADGSGPSHPLHFPAELSEYILRLNCGSIPGQSQTMLKWEGFMPRFISESARAIWQYPDEAKMTEQLASPFALAREGKYLVRLQAASLFDETQKQIIEFETIVTYSK